MPIVGSILPSRDGHGVCFPTNVEPMTHASRDYGIPPSGYRLPDATHVGAVRLQVADLQRSIDYYTEIIGLRVVRQDAGTAQLAAQGDDRPLVRLHARPGIEAVPRRGAFGLFHFAILLPDRASLGRVVTHLGAVGARAGSADHLVSEALYLNDAEGNGIELYRDRPRDEWPPPPEGSRVFMVTEPLDADGVMNDAEGDLPDAANGVDVGHVHLKVSDVEAAVDFWTGEVGMELMARYGTDAAFIADAGYHHHIGANAWHSRGAALEPADGPGLDHVVVAGLAADELATPDGVRILAV